MTGLIGLCVSLLEPPGGWVGVPHVVAPLLVFPAPIEFNLNSNFVLIDCQLQF